MFGWRDSRKEAETISGKAGWIGKFLLALTQAQSAHYPMAQEPKSARGPDSGPSQRYRLATQE